MVMSTLIIRNGLVHDGIHEEAFIADILVANGKIAKIAAQISEEEGKDAANSSGTEEVQILDAEGLEIYPGFVDAHCHIGLDGYAIGFEGKDYNEMGDPITPQLSAIDGINPQDVTFEQARSGGVTCVCTGPGSSNVIGGTFCAIKTYGKRVDDMVVKEKVAMKIAFGENPKRCYKDKGVCSRMSVAAKLREYLTKAIIYDEKRKLAGWPDQIDYAKMPAYDPKIEALVPVIRGELPLKAHAHRADDIFTAIRVAKEFGLKVVLDHVTDGSLIAEELAKEGFPVAVGPSFGHATKYELKNKDFETVADLAKAGCRVSIITDSPVIEQRFLNHCVGRAIYSGLDPFTALQAVTINAAKHIGIEDRVGSIEAGKDGDFVVVKGNPFTLDTPVLYTIINGKIVYQHKERA